MTLNKQTLSRGYAHFVAIFQRTEDHHIFLIAAGIAFNILIYLIPLFLMAIFFISMIYPTDVITQSIGDLLMQMLPPTPSTEEFVAQLLRDINSIFSQSAVAGWVGLFSMIWLSSMLFSSLRTGLNRIFSIPTPRFFLFYWIKDFAFTVVYSLLLILLAYIFPAMTYIKTFLSNNNIIQLGWVFSEITFTSMSLVLSFIVYYLIFRTIPNRRLPAFIINLSTGLCVVVIDISRRIFAWYMVSFTTYTTFYGGYAFIAMLAIWVFYLVMIILLAAELAQYIYDQRELRRASVSANESSPADAAK